MTESNNELDKFNNYKEVRTNYEGMFFKLYLPVIDDLSDYIKLNVRYIYADRKTNIDSLLLHVSIHDKLNRRHIINVNKYLQNNKTTFVHVSVKKSDVKVMLADSVLEYTFICADKKKYIISFSIDRERKTTFNEISVLNADGSEYSLLLESLIKASSTSEVEEKSFEELPTNKTIESNKNDDNSWNEDSTSIYSSSNIDDYSKAINQEIAFLKSGKGRKYRLVSGRKIAENKGIYSYSFEIESELHLVDDTPIKLAVGTSLADGSVLSCDDFSISVEINRDFGNSINAAFLEVEPWKLLETLAVRFQSLDRDQHKLAIKLMEEGPLLATKNDIINVAKGQKEVSDRLDTKNKSDDIVVVWGPPGTGKTYTMANIALNYIWEGKSVLVVSHSNVSVDGVIKKVLDLCSKAQSKDFTPIIHNGGILRNGYVRDDELNSNPYATSFNYTLTMNPELEQSLNYLLEEREEFRRRNQTDTPEYKDNGRKIKELRHEIHELEHNYVSSAKLVGTTISKVIIDPVFEDAMYDLVLFDEASMAYVPQLIVAASHAESKFMCVGDFKQLAPIAQSASKKVLSIDIYSYLKISDEKGNMYWHPWLVLLDEQRRMHPAISKYPNNSVYKNLLKNHSSVYDSRKK